ncbi:MAG: hypothetical protein IT236_08295 [Bacteroidia bacterium]|nr:hypothetical protein [Bacteroidia bacterium]
MKSKLLLLATLIYGGASFAQTEEKPWNVGLFAGRSEYNGDLGNGFFNFKKASYNFGAVSVSRYLT